MTREILKAELGPLFKLIFIIYELLWRAAAPALKLNSRLARGYEQRVVRKEFPVADIWIQAASAGESHLVAEILKKFRPDKEIRILLTSTTLQGIDILKEASSAGNSGKASIRTAFFPFDRPSLMERAVAQIGPKLVVMIETEIWPGLLLSLRKKNIRSLILNGRLTRASLNGYGYCRSLWPALSPHRILAVSADDASRFSALFRTDRVAVMPNIKFDRIGPQSGQDYENPLSRIIPENIPLIVMGSVRREEEGDIMKTISKILYERPGTIIAVFPRHIHRVRKWEAILSKNSIPWVLRSSAEQKTPAGTVIIGDLFGELVHAYELATSVFVGGSLHRKGGGQNFLEPLAYGVSPVIGPHWETFSWVGREIIGCGLVREAGNLEDLSKILLQESSRADRKSVLKRAMSYMEKRTGGAAIAAAEISASI